MAARIMTEAERRETISDSVASWALEGMHPTESTLREIRAYVAGEFDEDEFVERMKSKHRAS